MKYTLILCALLVHGLSAMLSEEEIKMISQHPLIGKRASQAVIAQALPLINFIPGEIALLKTENDTYLFSMLDQRHYQKSNRTSFGQRIIVSEMRQLVHYTEQRPNAEPLVITVSAVPTSLRALPAVLVIQLLHNQTE